MRSPDAPSPPVQVAPDELVDTVLAASRALVAVAARSLAAAGDEVTLPQYRALVVLAAQGPQGTAELAAALAVNPSTATRMCDRLVRKGLVRRYLESRAREIAGRSRNGHLVTVYASCCCPVLQQRVVMPARLRDSAPEKSPPLPFPWGTLTAVGIGLVAFGWGVLSGFNTEEFREIVRAAEATHPVPDRPTPRGGTAST